MQYKQKLLDLIFDEDDAALFNWILPHPVLEQVDILKEFKQLVQEMLADINDDSQAQALQLLDKKIDDYQESYLDEKLAQLQYEMAVEERDKLVIEMEDKIHRIRLYIKECIDTNAPNAKEMKEMAKGMIDLEKKDGFYKPENWAWFIADE